MTLAKAFESIIEYMKSQYKTPVDGNKVSLYIKRPNLFYKKLRVYIQKDDKEAINITDKLETENLVISMKDINIASLVYRDWYFGEKMKSTTMPYLKVEITYNKGWDSLEFIESESPDPIDTKDKHPIR